MKQHISGAIRRVLGSDPRRAGVVWRVLGRVTALVLPTNASGNNTSKR